MISEIAIFLAENPAFFAIAALSVIALILIVLWAAIRAAQSGSKLDDWAVRTVINALTFWMPGRRKACDQDHDTQPPTENK
jgi:heme A synthase